ncbi:MAG: GTP-sensing pleiotropic transcriptional regulator CodY [Granulicatella sp.]|jgi:codY GAF-like domain|uniref:GTP-sensing pleiotropic transcriptional regulator CodY n=1 Tax=uncultured Granulicatella sp. TaxID=316089 RepID=UPI001CB35C64|nr:GTP-sensing pleiotropic transcriptional regulator CodY [uncultured Granulicatella sp.]MBF1210681.1 GTP-sensing pleiotropic transcriptional regulator CodY [Granulicatella sp.]
MRKVLADLRKINEIVQYDNIWRDSETADLPFNKLTEILGTLLKVDLYIASSDGRLLGIHDEFQVNNDRMKEYKNSRQFPDFYMDGLTSLKFTKENIPVTDELTIFPVELHDNFKNAMTTIIPIFASGIQLGFVVMGKDEEPFSTDNLILAEHAGTVIGTEMLHWYTRKIEQEKREQQNVHLALSSLSYSELEAIKVIIQLFDGMDLRFTALKIAKEYNITRTVIVNAIRKLESAGIIESRSLGTKGTYIKIKNQNIKKSLLTELKHS